MFREAFVIKKGSGLYYSHSDWRPKFSANQEDAVIFVSYDKAEKFLKQGSKSNENTSMWFPEGTYQIEKWFVVED